MKYKIKLITSALAALMVTSNVSWSADSTEQVKTVNVNVDVNDDQGNVTIIKGQDKGIQTIKETFVVNQEDNVDDLVAAILEKHGVDKKYHGDANKITEIIDQHGKEMMWVQKNDDVDINLNNGQATVIIKKDHNGLVETIEQTMDVDADTDIDALVDQIMQEHGIEAGDATVHRKVIKLDKHLTQINSDKPRMGFMANAQDNGWQIISVVPDSGAAQAGMLKGDVVISIDGQSTVRGGLGLKEFTAYDKQAGEISKVLVLRDEQEINLNVTAEVIDAPDVIMSLDGLHSDLTSSVGDMNIHVKNLDGMMEGLQINVENLNNMVKGFDENQIHVVTTADADAYFFSGSKMDQWLGKNHHFSTVTESLGKYFGTSQGVLVLEVDKNNKLGLKDGDVIQAINGEDVDSPKDVVKIMSGFKSDESFAIEIIREKETIYLES